MSGDWEQVTKGPGVEKKGGGGGQIGKELIGGRLLVVRWEQTVGELPAEEIGRWG